MHPLLALDLEHPRLGQQADVPVHAGLGDIGHADAQVGGGSVRHGEVRVADGAGHASIGWTHPGAIVDAIRDLLG